MNRPYRDVPDSLLIECPVCRTYVLYERRAIANHEAACALGPIVIDEVYRPVPALPTESTK